ncbi:mitochondrial potassium channel ATP-binding subunit-like isoform X5 [Mytilus californianus]|uniref:mitochondrial potassium channel ATP-binding subunit-like isoform X5 n=1 Tax=Mytilus californianus TaxID=6549 RepID=UPI0022464260|nr:mitochondrial potassium channel ATP-binding subunit-like isoform X5 [Mytilus californianus]
MVFVQIQRSFGKPFAFRILNRCNQNLALGRNIETCKIKLRTHFNTALNSSSKKTSQRSTKWILGLSGMCGCVTMAIKHCPVAHCKTNVIKSRLDHLDNADVKSDAKFDWSGFFKLLVPELGYLIAAIISALAAAFINIKIPIVLGELVNVLSNFSREEAQNILDEIKKPALKLVKYYCIQGLLTFCYISLLTTVGENVATSLRKQLFDAYLRQDIEFFDRNKTGELVDRLTSDIQDFKSSFKLCISSGLRATAQTIGCVGTMYTISPKLTGLMITVVPAIIGTGTLMGSGLRKLSKKAQSQLSKSTAVADEAIGNVRTVRAFAMESKENEMFGQEVESSRKLNIELGLGIGAFQCLANIALNGIVLGTMFAGGRLMTRDEISAGDLMSFLVSTQTIERSLAQLSLLFGNVVRGLSAGARVFEFINAAPTIPLSGGKKIPFHSLRGDIKFQNVRFSYPTRAEQEVLKDFSLTIPAGKVVALVGLSGGGKSTVAALLERFYEVGQGKITLDGEDIKDLDPSWLRGRAIGFINQEPVLFATSVMENIRYGRPDATDLEVFEASDLANAHSFITVFHEGYKTVLGEIGVTVSGGQKQRIAIARALIKNPSILILDEATSALDAESERIVQEALNNMIKGRTVLIVAHRLSTIRDADAIAVVSNGKIVEQGTHDELRRKKGLYWELIRQKEIEEEIEEMKGHFF